MKTQLYSMRLYCVFVDFFVSLEDIGCRYVTDVMRLTTGLVFLSFESNYQGKRFEATGRERKSFSDPSWEAKQGTQRRWDTGRSML